MNAFDQQQFGFSPKLKAYCRGGGKSFDDQRIRTIIVYLPCSDKRLVFGSTGAFFHLQILHETEQPFIDQEVELLLKKQQALLFDLE